MRTLGNARTGTGGGTVGGHRIPLEALPRGADALAIVRRTGLIATGSNAWRVDSLPFGGLGNSGLGRAEVRFMVEELTQRKALVIRRRKGRQR